MANFFQKLIKKDKKTNKRVGKPEIVMNYYNSYGEEDKHLMLSNINDDIFQNLKGFKDVERLIIHKSLITKLPKIKDIGKNISNIKFDKVEGLSKCNFREINAPETVIFENCKGIKNLEFNPDIKKIIFEDCDVTGLDLSNCPRDYIKFSACKGVETVKLNRRIKQLYLGDCEFLHTFNLSHLEGTLKISHCTNTYNLELGKGLHDLEMDSCILRRERASNIPLNLTNTNCDIKLNKVTSLDMIRLGDNENISLKNCGLSYFNFNNAKNIVLDDCFAFEGARFEKNIENLFLKHCDVSRMKLDDDFRGKITMCDCRPRKEGGDNPALNDYIKNYNEKKSQQNNNQLIESSNTKSKYEDIENLENKNINNVNNDDLNNNDIDRADDMDDYDMEL